MADQQYEPVMPMAVTPMNPAQQASPVVGGADQYEIPQYPAEPPPAASATKDKRNLPKHDESTELRTAQLERSKVRVQSESQSSGEKPKMSKSFASSKKKGFCKKYTVFQRVALLIGIIFLLCIGLGLTGAYVYFAFFGLEGRKK